MAFNYSVTLDDPTNAGGAAVDPPREFGWERERTRRVSHSAHILRLGALEKFRRERGRQRKCEFDDYRGPGSVSGAVGLRGRKASATRKC